MKSTSKSLHEPTRSTLVSEEIIRYQDLATKQKINRHLSDINDIITDDDIRNIDTNLTKNILSSPKKA
ncbi:MAG TPA: hypothetical protein PK504_07500 [Ferruginibacter sp.]|nr:hypothetical protein [Ferruginibacter sp.]HRE64015.1 hypothetical protein [Ferruginibacter sp.]